MLNIFTSDAVSIGRRRQYFLLGNNTCHGWGFRSILCASARLSYLKSSLMLRQALLTVGFGTTTS